MRTIDSFCVAVLIFSAVLHCSVQKNSTESNGFENDAPKSAGSEDGAKSAKTYHILMVTFCLRGHFNPAAGK